MTGSAAGGGATGGRRAAGRMGRALGVCPAAPAAEDLCSDTTHSQVTRHHWSLVSEFAHTRDTTEAHIRLTAQFWHTQIQMRGMLGFRIAGRALVLVRHLPPRSPVRARVLRLITSSRTLRGVTRIPSSGLPPRLPALACLPIKGRDCVIDAVATAPPSCHDGSLALKKVKEGLCPCQAAPTCQV